MKEVLKMIWAIIGFVVTAVDLYYEYIDKSDDYEDDFSELKQILNNLNANLEEVKNAVIREIPREILESRLADLSGDVEGLVTNFNGYYRYDEESEHAQWETARLRLIHVVNEAPGVMADLKNEINHQDLNHDIELDQAINVFCLYAVLVPVRALALEELKINYGQSTEVEISNLIQDAKKLSRRLYPELRERSNNRFSKGIVEMRGEPWNGGFTIIGGYRFNGKFIVQYEVAPNIPRSHWRERAIKAFKEHKKKAFDEYGGLALDALLKLPPYHGSAIIRSARYPSRVIVGTGNEPVLGVITWPLQDVNFKEKAVFKIGPGLSKENSYSFEPINMEGFYLNTTPTGALNLVITQESDTSQYRNHATFNIVESLSGDPFPNVSIESSSSPGQYIYDMGPSDWLSHIVQIGNSDSEEFKEQATFSLEWIK